MFFSGNVVVCYKYFTAICDEKKKEKPNDVEEKLLVCLPTYAHLGTVLPKHLRSTLTYVHIYAQL